MTAFSACALFVVAFISALFFQGLRTEFLALPLAAVTLWWVSALWSAHADGLRVPRSPAACWLTLLCLWSALSIAWAAVHYIGVIHFWWIASLPLVFWAYTLSPGKDMIWRLAFVAAVVVCLALVLAATYQLLVLQQQPTATFYNKNSLAALLNLAALPLSAYFLLQSSRQHPGLTWLMGAALFVLLFGLALVNGRGAFLSGGGALLLLALVAARSIPRGRIAALCAIPVAAFVVANAIALGQSTTERMSTMLDPWGAGATRTIIYRQAWKMFQDLPWWGVGPGQFALLWPPYRDPQDSSAGYYVHNDYLQILIEAGVPGLLLMLVLFASVALLFVRALRRSHVSPMRAIEITGLFCGMAAVAVHSLVDFNFYIPSILLLLGLVLGRFHALAVDTVGIKSWHFKPAKVLGRGAWRTITALLLAFPLVYFIAVGWASYRYHGALAMAAEGKLAESYDAFEATARLLPGADNVLMSQADLLRHLLAELPPQADPVQRKILFDEARTLLERALRINPYRPHTYGVLAQLLRQARSDAGPDWAEQAGDAYLRALRVNPRTYEARYLYAQLMLEHGRREEARRVLEDGMVYWYLEYDHIAPFYALTAKLRREAGDHAGAEVLKDKITHAMQVSGHRWPPLPERLPLRAAP